MNQSTQGMEASCHPEEGECQAYVVIGGASFMSGEEEVAFTAILAGLREHLQQFPEALIVFEDFDKLSCYFRTNFRAVRCPFTHAAIDMCLQPPAVRLPRHVA